MSIRSEAHTDPAGVQVITIDRPERRNAIDHAAVVGLRAALGALDPSTRVVVLTGGGNNFCAGADLSTVEDGAFVDELAGLLEDLRSLAQPVIAAIKGPALGAGTQLALACDLRITSVDATFGIPAAKLGLTVDAFTVHHLANAVGHSIARAMLLAAEVFDAERLAAVGFVHRLIRTGTDVDVLGAGIEWAGEIAKLAPLTMSAHKVMLVDAEHEREPADRARRARSAAWESDDLAEGLAAFGERRRPEFQGR